MQGSRQIVTQHAPPGRDNSSAAQASSLEAAHGPDAKIYRVVDRDPKRYGRPPLLCGERFTKAAAAAKLKALLPTFPNAAIEVKPPGRYVCVVCQTEEEHDATHARRPKHCGRRMASMRIRYSTTTDTTGPVPAKAVR